MCQHVILARRADLPRAAQTTALSVVDKLTPQPLLISDSTPAGLYRTINDRKYTLLMDEAENGLLGNKTLRSLLNSGAAARTATARASSGQRPPAASAMASKLRIFSARCDRDRSLRPSP